MGLCKEGGPAIQVQRNDGQACLLMPWDMMFSEEQQEQWRGQRARGVEGKRREGGRRKGSEGVWWPHVTVACILQASMLNIDAEAENKPFPNTRTGWWTGEDRLQTRLSATTPPHPLISLSIRHW